MMVRRGSASFRGAGPRNGVSFLRCIVPGGGSFPYFNNFRNNYRKDR